MMNVKHLQTVFDRQLCTVTCNFHNRQQASTNKKNSQYLSLQGDIFGEGKASLLFKRLSLPRVEVTGTEMNETPSTRRSSQYCHQNGQLAVRNTTFDR